MSPKEKVYGRTTKTNHNSSPWALGSGELITEQLFSSKNLFISENMKYWLKSL